MGNLAAGLEERLQALETELCRLEAERARYAEWFLRAPCAGLATDGRGAILEANEAAAQLLGRPAGALAGQLLASFVPMEQRRVFAGKVAALAPGGREAWAGALRGRRGDARVEFIVAAQRGARPALLYWVLRPLA